MTAEFHVFTCLSDNIGVLMRDTTTGACASIDAPEEGPILAALEETGWQLTDILVTHKHLDHVAGVAPLKERFGARVVAPAREAEFVPQADLLVNEGDRVMVGTLASDVIFTPGHTAGHIVFHFDGAKALFAGDTLFALGCGRLLEGTPADMWHSLQKLAALPDDTLVFCGHEYTLSNARFALAADPDNQALKLRAAVVEGQRADGQLTIPSRLQDEKATNPFLRADRPELARSVKLDGRDPVAVFAALREWKNSF
ncbi:hydroxyacylglutathione hydrolase [Chelatococcus reniformis]|uniref:Hydroxyacylglutathione hydrolase n=1 Tax=Chelatococcus reniformis TaxID=1494448 RepID=A0A916X830_9HYPH|nr:hydroxyacylglutathione hydrolase [Chelatococcus reniformis]GGC46409.1 hydroxyacylglutathione hydrolase [Chelatococcus reniformis]